MNQPPNKEAETPATVPSPNPNTLSIAEVAKLVNRPADEIEKWCNTEDARQYAAHIHHGEWRIFKRTLESGWPPPPRPPWATTQPAPAATDSTPSTALARAESSPPAKSTIPPFISPTAEPSRMGTGTSHYLAVKHLVGITFILQGVLRDTVNWTPETEPARAGRFSERHEANLKTFLSAWLKAMFAGWDAIVAAGRLMNKDHDSDAIRWDVRAFALINRMLSMMNIPEPQKVAAWLAQDQAEVRKAYLEQQKAESGTATLVIPEPQNGSTYHFVNLIYLARASFSVADDLRQSANSMLDMALMLEFVERHSQPFPKNPLSNLPGISGELAKSYQPAIHAHGMAILRLLAKSGTRMTNESMADMELSDGDRLPRDARTIALRVDELINRGFVEREVGKPKGGIQITAGGHTFLADWNSERQSMENKIR